MPNEPRGRSQNRVGIDHRNAGGLSKRSGQRNLVHADNLTDAPAISKAKMAPSGHLRDEGMDPDTLGRMKTQRSRWWSVVVGMLLALAGTVWALQGAGMLGGSAMSGNTIWVLIGVPVAAAGVWLAWRGLAPR